MEHNYEAIHKKSGWHEELIKKSKICGCFYCLSLYPPEEIKEWITEHPQCNRGPGKTAICPICGIDSVLPDCVEPELNKELLEKMYLKYF